MIFVTVGTQLGFDRLIQAVDSWAENNSGVDIFAQTGPSTFTPKFMKHADFVSPSKADELMRQAEIIISHAGMGSILTALRYQRPIVVMPRKAEFGEHRNDHQLATARWMAGRPGIQVAWDESEIAAFLDNRNAISTGPQLPEYATGLLVEKLSTFINGVK